MANPFDYLPSIDKLIPLFRTLITLIIFLVLFNLTLNAIKRALLRRAKTKHQTSNIKIFSRIAKYGAFLTLVIFAIFTYAGSWTGLGLSVGLFSAALGWALQRPITGIAGWMMVVIKRPFDIGDRIIIGKVRGDVIDITLTHVYIQEIGGIVGGEENSGRVVMVPNSKLFEQDIINYTLEDEYILSQVAVTITFESNLDKAIKIALDSTKKFTKELDKEHEKKPYVRTYFDAKGMNVRVRFFTPAKQIQEFTSNVSKEIFTNFMKAKDVEIAYPHTEILYRKKSG
ncbi:mechanosensitive ion channel family protein [Candidatus Woesearchaeota archaeon]|nr:mechanosensitive ion channel family protein [Candidatus Woesearchaeota archaeon]